MAGLILERRLSAVTRRLHRLRLLRRQTVCWLLVMIPANVLCLLLPATGLPLRRESLSLVVACGVGLILARWRQAAPTWLETARLVEQHNPSLSDIVLTALRYRSSDSTVSPVLASRVLKEADDIALVADWDSVVSGQRIFSWFTASLIAFLVLVSSVVTAGRLLPLSYTENSPAVRHSELNDAAMQVTVEPGDVEIGHGTGLTIAARFTGKLPSRAVVRFRPDEQQAEVGTENESSASATTTYSMSLTVDTGVFMVRLPAVTQDGSYVVLYGDDDSSSPGRLRHASDAYRITTYLRPRVEQVDASIFPPKWTGRDPTTIEDTLRIAAINGSTVTLNLHLNKPVTVSHLKSENNIEIPLSAVSSDRTTLQTTLTASVDTTWTVFLQDRQGRSASEDTTITLRIIRNESPTIRITFPQPDISVSALQEVVTEAEASDDFGILDYGICWALADGTTQSVSLAQDDPVTARVGMKHTLELETLGAQPNDLLTWHFYADTYVNGGRIQRSLSDLMFADVRQFEEIFRESDQQASQAHQNQNGPSTGDLLQIQRQIAIAIWNVQRSLTGSSWNADAVTIEDVTAIRQSQEVALAQLNEIRESATVDNDATDSIAAAGHHMKCVVDALTDWSLQAPEPTMADAYSGAQAAFRELLRLRTAAHEVQRSQPRQGQDSQQQTSLMQRQLAQLELDNNRNRYESEQQAQQNQQTEEQREQLQVLNRLKDLARRQDMINERLKRLQSELRIASDTEQREHINRELKRLRDEQQDLLRDVDELRVRMDQSSSHNSPPQHELREQVDQARENVRRASRAMNDAKLSQALSEGTRAERQFDQLQEDYRQQTSTAFTEAARDLRQQARQLNQRQQQIANQLRGGNPDVETPQSHLGPPSLRSQKYDDEIERKLGQQRDSLRRIVKQSKELVQQSEDSESLLARRLYETLKQVENLRTEDALHAAEFLAGRGLWARVTEAEQAARRGLEELQQGIEGAAEAVLGSEAESLRRAKTILDQLSEELSDELSEAMIRKLTQESVSQQTDQKKQSGNQLGQSGQLSAEPRSELHDYSVLRGGGRESSDTSTVTKRPLTGSHFHDWSDRLRDVEEILDDAGVRQQVAGIRDRARSIRAQFRRHGTEPQWDLVKSGLLAELQSLRRRLAQDIAALVSNGNMVPIDREPVPEEFEELVHRYYELLGQERDERAP